MEGNNSQGMRNAPGKQVHIIVRLCLAVFVLVGGMAIAWTMLGPHAQTLATGGITEYPTQTNPWGVTLDTIRGYVWVAEPGCDSSPVCSAPPKGVIGRYALGNPAVGENNFVPPAIYNPVFLAIDGSGNVWFTDPTHNAIGELIPGTNTWNEYKAPTANAAPYDLLLDKNGHIWFTEIRAGEIGFFDPSTHTFVEKKTPTATSGPYGITMDASGTVWFTENSLSKIGYFVPTTTGTGIAITEIAVTSGIHPHLITSDSKGNIWYSEGFAGKVGTYNPSTKAYKDYAVSTSSNTHISGIGVDSNGIVWFNDSLTAQVGALNPTTGKSSTVVQFTFSSAHPHDGLTIENNNHVWITEQFGLNLGKI